MYNEFHMLQHASEQPSLDVKDAKTPAWREAGQHTGMPTMTARPGSPAERSGPLDSERFDSGFKQVYTDQLLSIEKEVKDRPNKTVGEHFNYGD